VETEIIGLADNRHINYQFEYSDIHYENNSDKTGDFIITNSKDVMESFYVSGVYNCDIYLQFRRNEQNYCLFIKKFENSYRSFYYIQRDVIMTDNISRLDSLLTNIISNVKAKDLNGVLGSDFIVQIGDIKKFILNFNLSIFSHEFFDGIIIEELREGTIKD